MSRGYRKEQGQGIACAHVCGLSWSFVRNLGQGRRPSEEEDIGLSPWTVSGQLTTLLSETTRISCWL